MNKYTVKIEKLVVIHPVIKPHLLERVVNEIITVYTIGFEQECSTGGVLPLTRTHSQIIDTAYT